MFRTRGLRVGALHQAVRFSTQEPKTQEVAPEALPQVQVTEDLEIEGVKLPNGNALLKLLWGRKSGLALQNVDVSSGDRLMLFLPSGLTAVNRSRSRAATRARSTDE